MWPHFTHNVLPKSCDGQARLQTMIRWFATLIIAIALTGAPFGMGRMMDGAHDMAAMQGMSHNMSAMHHDTDMPKHAAAVPHFMMCAACVAAVPDTLSMAQIAVLTGVLKAGFIPQLEGVRAAPDLPPPRA